MQGTVTEKILKQHLISGRITEGEEIGIAIDQTLTQDATGTTAFLLFEAMGIKRVKTEVSVSYVDHNLAQFGPENHNDHRYLQSIAHKVGAHHSRPGNGICHQVHLERFAAPGKTLLGSDSHTPTAGGIGSLAIGAGGLDVAAAMGGAPFYLPCPKVLQVELIGSLNDWVAPKDIILKILSILTTRGNVGTIIEYTGDGITTLSVPARATCTNMGAELGVTTSIFPSDEITQKFLRLHGRASQFIPLSAQPDARYDRITKYLHAQRESAVIENIRRYCPDAEISAPDDNQMVQVSFSKIRIDLSSLVPLAAAPSSPDNIVAVEDLTGTKVQQVVIGSCTNSSFHDLMVCASILKGRKVHQQVELGIAPGSKTVLTMLIENGALADMVRAGARILECACGPCIGQGFSPCSGCVSLRTFNRNFSGRSGTPNDKVYLISPEVAVAAAITGEITDPRTLGIEYPHIEEPESITIDDGMIIPPAPADKADEVEIIRPATIVKPPAGEVPPDTIAGVVLIKLGDSITTDHIMPAGALLKLRSNVPEYAKHVFAPFNKPSEPTFAQRAWEAKNTGLHGIIVAGESYGQGSSREHAALCPMYLGIKAVIAKSIERIHQANLVNFAILPLIFDSPEDYNRIDKSDHLKIENVIEAIKSADTVLVNNQTKGLIFTCRFILTRRQREILAAGGLLNYTRQASSQ